MTNWTVIRDLMLSLQLGMPKVPIHIVCVFRG
jgi:hypothetical protein